MKNTDQISTNEAWRLLAEARLYGQFSDYFDQPQAKSVRAAIRHIIDEHMNSSEAHNDQTTAEEESLCKQLDIDDEPAFYWHEDPVIDDLTFKLTCGACPEQYDVFRGDKQVAYVRLRWARLRVDVPDVGGETIFLHDFPEEYKGIFANEDERAHWLKKVAEAINKQ